MSATKLEFDSDGSFIEHVTYHVKEKELVVRMREGRVYHHPGVDINKYMAFMAAESHGVFYNKSIKGQYPHVASKEELKRNEDAFTLIQEMAESLKKSGTIINVSNWVKRVNELNKRKV